MKILIHSHFFLPSVGGVERLVDALARGFVERGLSVSLVTETDSRGFDDTALPYSVLRRPSLAALVRKIRESDMVHLAGPAFLPMLLGILLRKPVVVEHHMYQATCPNGLLIYQPNRTVCPGHFLAGRHGECLRCNARLGRWRSFRMWLVGFPRLWLCRRVAANVAVTEHARRRQSLPNSRVIYHGVAPEPQSTRRPHSAGERNAAVCFAYVGRFVREKGLPLLVQAAARLRDDGLSFRLKFIGDGPERAGLEAAVKNAGLADRTTFTGMLGPEELRRETVDVTALVMPSVWEETAGMAAIEQMMQGRPVVVSDIGGLGEVVNGAGFRFPAGDVAALAGHLRSIVEDPALALRMGEKAARRAVELFDRERMIGEHLRLYREILEGKFAGASRTSQ